VPTVPAADLLTFTRALFQSAGLPTDEASTVAAALVDANLCGHDSHGVIRIDQYLKALRNGQLRAGVSLQVVHEAPAILIADGQWGFGQVQVRRLLERLVPKARAAGVTAGTLRHAGHIGRLGEYAEWVTQQGCAVLCTVNGHGLGRGVAPPGGIECRIGTNPLCLGVPTAGDPLILDISTSVVAEGKVRVAFNKGVPAPEGWLLDEQGRPTTDPGVLYREPRGSILPLGNYKGFGLGLVLDPTFRNRLFAVSGQLSDLAFTAQLAATPYMPGTQRKSQNLPERSPAFRRASWAERPSKCSMKRSAWAVDLPRL